jgi:hypothetical protein
MHQILAPTESHTKLLSSMRDLLDAYELLLGQMPQQPADANQPTEGRLTLSAGPFASIEALRAFEQSLAGIPGVRDVAVRGYEGEDRAILDVRLSEQTA